MDRFEGATSVRLMGAHKKYLWAEPDHYGVRQENEDKNLQALWRVERNKTGTTLRLKSCFDTYLTASEQRYRGVGFLSFAGKRVTQMRPENVESTNCFDWEPVIDQGRLRLKSCYGTYLRANSNGPPWNSHVTHDLPQHERHLDWLVWEVGKVAVPNITPLELVIGSIHLVENEQLPAQEKSKLLDKSERFPVQERTKHPDAATARQADDSERHPERERLSNQKMVLSGRTDEPDERLLGERPKNSGVGRVRKVEVSERHTVHERERDPVVGTTRRADKSGHDGQQRARKGVGPVQTGQQRASDPAVKTVGRTADSEGHSAQNGSRNPDSGSVRNRRADESGRHPVHESGPIAVTIGTANELGHGIQEMPQNPGVSSVRRRQHRTRDPDVKTATRRDDLEGHSAQNTSQNPGVGSLSTRRADESGRHSVHERGRNSVAGTTGRAEEFEHKGPQRPKFPNEESGTSSDESERRPVQQRARSPNIGTANRTDDFERPPAQKRSQYPGVSIFRRADESQRRLEQGGDRNPDVGIPTRTDDPEWRSVQKRYEKYQNAGVGTARRAPESESLNNVQVTARRDQESDRRPVQETTRRTQELDLRPVQEAPKRDQESERLPRQETAKRAQELERRPAVETRRARASERHPVPETIRIPEVSTARRTNDSDRYSMQARYENLDGTTAKRVQKSERQSTRERFKTLDVGTARTAERHPLQETESDPDLDTALGADQSEPYPIYYPEEDRIKHLVVTTSRRANETTESHGKATSRPHR